MELTSVGFYKEMPHGGDSELSILDFVDKAKDNIDKIVKYTELSEADVLAIKAALDQS